eukprot:COSAG04_NODE_8361_length_985_cov_4.984199_1_plen_210_part_00
MVVGGWGVGGQWGRGSNRSSGGWRGADRGRTPCTSLCPYPLRPHPLRLCVRGDSGPRRHRKRGGVGEWERDGWTHGCRRSRPRLCLPGGRGPRRATTWREAQIYPRCCRYGFRSDRKRAAHSSSIVPTKHSSCDRSEAVLSAPVVHNRWWSATKSTKNNSLSQLCKRFAFTAAEPRRLAPPAGPAPPATPRSPPAAPPCLEPLARPPRP